MSRCWVLFLAVPLFAANVPNRYIVQLAGEPVAVHAARVGARLHSVAADAQRAAIRTEQAQARTRIEQMGGVVRDSLETLTNALVVEIPDADAAQLAGAPGVVAVYPERQFEMTLDHALPLHRVPDAWSQVGMGNAGAGVMIGMIDSGIEIGHGGFNDAGFKAPAGYPITGAIGDQAYTNNKVIVARSYASLFAARDPDTSVRDHVGHGTATAMAAAGVTTSGPLATITGVAPRAYIGVYKVFGSPGVNDTATESAILKALGDAVNDGMNVINLSLGYPVPSLAAQDPFVQAVEAANSMGVIVVASAGNSGPNPGTVGTPAVAPHAIAAAASNNDRMFAGTLQISGGASYTALPGSGVNSFTPISGRMADVANLDGNGLACAPLPGQSLNGAIALIERGNCSFESKLDNAQAAGAVTAIVYDNVANEAPVLMGVGQATLPAAMVSNSDGLKLKGQISGGPSATVQFYAPMSVSAENLAGFSAAGPTLENSVKPDITAVGENFYTATETLDPAGELYNPTGYTITQGTSFSAPLVSGAVALLKAARPGLTADAYRSLLINSADAAYASPGNAAHTQQGGAGFMDVLNAVNATAAVSPVSLSFGTSTVQTHVTATFTLTNTGANSETFQFSAAPLDRTGPAPQFATTQARLDPGASTQIPVTLGTARVSPGEYDGFIVIQPAGGGAPARVPYWFAVPSGKPVYLTALNTQTSGTAGGTLNPAVVFRVTDASGIPVSVTPTATVVSGGGRIVSVAQLGSAYPKDYGLSVRLGTQPGTNVFQIQAGQLTLAVTITGQ